jgi:hypothetical protein
VLLFVVLLAEKYKSVQNGNISTSQKYREGWPFS